jgi:tRNA-uridine 2-sulfurtransferase
MKKRVLVGMSGGVDSSVAAALLREQGYDVVGVTMRLWALDRDAALPGRQHCCSVDDADDAREVAGMLGIPHYVLNFEQAFASRVVDHFVREYRRGRTPNPCVACNEHIKFRALLERARALDADYLATGHYARRLRRAGCYELLRAVDHEKDQSYVLYMLGQAELARVLFPLGPYTKAEVRSLARRLGLPVADKPDSVEICFVPDNDYRGFLRGRIPRQPGQIVDSAGSVLGVHDGVAGYTVGQRRGLGAFGDARYVIELEPESERVIIGSADELYSTALQAERVHYVAGVPPAAGSAAEVKIRYKATPAAATLHPNAGGVEVRFEQAQRAVTPGQAIAFYDGDTVLGGGTIERALRSR